MSGVIRQALFSKRLLEYANTSRKAGFLNDITIQVGNESFPCNRLLLACYSKVFEKIIKSETKDSQKTIDLKSVDKNTFKLLIDFVYSGDIAINKSNFISLLEGAKVLEMEELKEVCLHYLESSLNIKDCFSALKATAICDNKKFTKKVYEFFSENFSELAKRNEFSEISLETLKAFLAGLNRDLVEESLIYKCVTDWTKYDGTMRFSVFPDLLQLVELDKLSSEFLEDVVSVEDLILDDITCSRKLIKVISMRLKATRIQKLYAKRLTKPYDSSSLLKPPPITKITLPRSPSENITRSRSHSEQLKNRIMCLGKWHSGNKITELYNIVGNISTVNYPDLPVYINSHSAVVSNQYLYCIGGIYTDLNEVTKQVWKMSLKEPEKGWRKAVSMNEKRSLMGSTTYNGLIVVAGGRISSEVCLSSSEYYDPSGRWIMLPNMNEPRYGNSLVTCKGILYSIGGATNSYNSLNSVECLRGIPGSCWEKIHPMINHRSCFSASVYEGAIYVIGGASNPIYDSDIDEVEKYKPEIDSWMSLQKIKPPRSNHASCIFHDKIYVAGGHQQKQTMSYDPSKDSWTVVEEKNLKDLPVSIFLLFSL